LALDNVRLFNQLQDALRETQILQRFTQSLGGTLVVDEMIKAFIEAIKELLGVDYALFSLVDPRHDQIRAVAGHNVSQDYVEQASHALDSADLTAEIIRTGRTEAIRDAADPRLGRQNVGENGASEWSLRIFSPVSIRQDTIGLVELGFKDELSPELETTQLQLLKTLIGQAAVSLDNAQRYDETQRRARREQTIREITDKLRTSPNLDALLRTATQELGQRLGARHAVLELGVGSKSADTAIAATPLD
jgi:GAF domain-containing protein